MTTNDCIRVDSTFEKVENEIFINPFTKTDSDFKYIYYNEKTFISFFLKEISEKTLSTIKNNEDAMCKAREHYILDNDINNIFSKRVTSGAMMIDLFLSLYKENSIKDHLLYSYFYCAWIRADSGYSLLDNYIQNIYEKVKEQSNNTICQILAKSLMDKDRVLVFCNETSTNENRKIKSTTLSLDVAKSFQDKNGGQIKQYAINLGDILFYFNAGTEKSEYEIIGLKESFKEKI